MKKFLLPLLFGISVSSAAVTARAQSFVAVRPQSTYVPYYFGTLAGLAGNGGSADGTGSAARFFWPWGVAVDSARNVYVANYGNHTIRKISPIGVVSTLAGLAGSSGSADGTGSGARFDLPCGVAVDSSGNVYVADTYNQTIRKITPAGAVSTLAGSADIIGSADGTGAAARFSYPFGVAVDSAGSVYVADTYNQIIRKISPAGVVSTLAGLAGVIGSADGIGSAARFNWPRSVAVDSAGDVYVADTNNSMIRKISPAGAVSVLAGSPGSVGNADGAGSTAQFSFPHGVAVDDRGNVYVADTEDGQAIRIINSTGKVRTLAGLYASFGSADGIGSNARFCGPNGVAADSAGNVYVGDTYNHTIRIGVLPLTLAKAVARRTHASFGELDLDLAPTGTPSIECRTGGANGEHTLVFSFNHDVASGNATVTAGAGSVSGTPTLSANEVSVNLTGVANAQTLTLTLSNVTDNLGQTLPATTVSISFLLGDTNGDGIVNAGDVLQTRNRSGQATNANNFRSDVNADGVVNSGDALTVRLFSGTALP